MRSSFYTILNMKNFEFKGESHNFLGVSLCWQRNRCRPCWWHLDYSQNRRYHLSPTKWIPCDQIHRKRLSESGSHVIYLWFSCHGFLYPQEFHPEYGRTFHDITDHHIARQTFSTPMHIPSVEQVELKDNTPFASQQMILLYLELFLITLIREH